MQGSRAILYRHMDLMHYVYIENLGADKYIGLCLIFNNIRAQYIKNLFDFLRNVIENHALKAKKFIEYSSDGNIIFSKKQFCDDIKSYDYLKSIINATLDNKNNFGFEELPTKYSGINKTEYVDWNEQNKVILKQSDSCNRIIIEDSLGIQKNNTHQIITSLKDEIIKKDNTIQFLNDKISSLEKKKKQYRNVLILFIIVLGCCGGLFFLYNSLSHTKTNLRETEYQLRIANDTISSNKSHILNLNTRINNLESALENETRLKNNAENSLQSICSYSPFAVTRCDVNADQFKFNYFCPEEREVTVTLKAINEKNSEIVTSTHTLTFYKGTGSKSLDFYWRLDNSQYYYVVLMYDGHIIAGKRW